MYHFYRIDIEFLKDQKDTIYVASRKRLETQEIGDAAKRHSDAGSIIEDWNTVKIYEADQRNGKETWYHYPVKLCCDAGLAKNIVMFLYADGDIRYRSLFEVAENLNSTPTSIWKAVVNANRKLSWGGNKIFSKRMDGEAFLPHVSLPEDAHFAITSYYRGEYPRAALEETQKITGETFVFLDEIEAKQMAIQEYS